MWYMYTDLTSSCNWKAVFNKGARRGVGALLPNRTKQTVVEEREEFWPGEIALFSKKLFLHCLLVWPKKLTQFLCFLISSNEHCDKSCKGFYTNSAFQFLSFVCHDCGMESFQSFAPYLYAYRRKKIRPICSSLQVFSQKAHFFQSKELAGRIMYSSVWSYGSLWDFQSGFICFLPTLWEEAWLPLCWRSSLTSEISKGSQSGAIQVAVEIACEKTCSSVGGTGLGYYLQTQGTVGCVSWPLWSEDGQDVPRTYIGWGFKSILVWE